MPDNFYSTISGVTLQPLKLPSKSVSDVLDEQFGPVPTVQAPAVPTSFDQFPEVTADEAAAEGVDLDEFGAFEEPDAIDLSTPEELADDPEFDVETFVRQNPESLNDPFKRETLLEAERISRMRGLNLRKVAVDAIKASPGIVADFAKGARDTTDRLIGAAVQPGASAVLGGAQVALGQMDDQTRRELVKEIKREQKKALAELSAGSETAAFGMANLLRTGSRKILNKVGGLTDAVGLTEGADLENASFEQLERDLLDDIAFREQAEAVARGQGAAAEAIGLDADTLRKEGIELDPAAIESISFADPLTLVATGGAFKLVSAGGKVLATTKTVQQATRLASKLGTTVVRGGRAAAGGTIAGTGRVISATGRGVERFGQAARPALKAAGGVAGVVKGAELGGLAGAVVGAGAGASGGARIAQGISALGRFGQRVGQATVSAGRQVAGTQAPNRFFRTISKIATSTPVQGAAIGAAAAAPLALAVETDEEAAQLLGAGIGLGGAAGAGASGLRGVVSLRERFVGGRLLDPQSQPRPRLRKSADYGSDAALDTSHKAAFDQMPPEQQALVNEFRELFRDEGEIYVQDPQQYGAQLARLAEAEKGVPLTPEEAAAVQQFANTHAVFSAEFPTAGGPKKVVLLNKDAAGLTHDAGHLFESLLPEADRAALQQEVLRRYTPEELQGFKEAYERALNAGLPEGAPRRQLTAEELASEIIAENFSALFSNLDVSTLGTPRPLMDRLIQSAASLAERAGIDLTGGRGTPNLGARPSFGVTQMLENLVRQRESARRAGGGNAEPPRVDLGTEQPAPGPRNKRVTPTEQAGTAAPAPETAGIAAARAFAEQAKDPTLTKVVDDISAAFERKRGEVTPLEFEVLGAKETEPGRVSTRQQRLEERLAADVAEAAGTAPEDVRQLFQAVQVPIRFEVRGRGANRTLQLLGMSLDKVMANVGILTREAAKRGIQRLVPYDLTPEGALTPDAWRRFQKDLVSYTENQQNGFRGDGRELIRPDESLGASIPEENPNYNPTVLPEEVGNFINLLQGIAPPRTARVTGPGVPGNVKARTIAELNLRPVEEPARILPRDQAKQTFPTGETIGETNPLRNEFARSGFEIRDLHEVTERFNVDRIKSVKPRSELQFRAPFTDVVRAGFLPKTGPERARFLPSTGAKPGSNDAVRRVARTYARESGIEFKPTEGLSKVDEPLMERIADEFDAAPNAPDDPAVRASYDAMIAETVAQYRAMEAAGVKIEPFKGEGGPYKNSAEMAADVRDNNHLYFLKTEGAFGESGIPANHALLEPSPVSIGGERLLNNDLFRAVHDYFGHAMEGTQFGPRGEFNAWRAHSEMFSPEAQGALAAETLAQNSWVNFGEHLRNTEGRIPKRGEEGFVPPQERPFAEQKMFVVSEDTIAAAKRQASEGVAPLDAAKFLPAEPYQLVAAVAQLDGAEFKKAMDSQEGGLTGAAIRLGKKFNSPEQVEILSVLEEQAKTQMREALTSGRMDEAMLLASKPQFFREARESATGTGSIGSAEARGQQFLPRAAGEAKTELGRTVTAGQAEILDMTGRLNALAHRDPYVEFPPVAATTLNGEPTTSGLSMLDALNALRRGTDEDGLLTLLAEDPDTGEIVGDVKVSLADMSVAIAGAEGSPVSAAAAQPKARLPRTLPEPDVASPATENVVSSPTPRDFASRLKAAKDTFTSEPPMKVPDNMPFPHGSIEDSGWVDPSGQHYSVEKGKKQYHDDFVEGFAQFTGYEMGRRAEDFQRDTGAMRVAIANSPVSLMDYGDGFVGISISRKPTSEQIGYINTLLSARVMRHAYGGELVENSMFSTFAVDITGPDGNVVAGKTFQIRGKADEGALRRFLRDPFADEFKPPPGARFLPRAAGEAKTELGRTVTERDNLSITRPPASGVFAVELRNPEGRVVADISAAQVSPDTANVDLVFVSPDLRGKQVAEALYRELATDLQQAGVTKLMGGAVNDIPLRIRRKVFGDFELLTDALERPVSEQDALTRLRETREAEARGDTSRIEMVSATSRIDPNTRFLPKKREQKKLPLPPKAFIEPDGTFTKVDRVTHDDYLIENSDALNKKYGTAIPKKQGKGDVRIGALAKGFVRVTYEPNQGRLTYEANAKTFGKAQRDKIFEHVADNLDSIDNIRISLVDDKGKVVKSADRRFFLMDEDSQKLDSIPFVTDEGRPERSTFFLPKGTLEDRAFAAEVEKIAKGEKEGETFNIDGTIFNPTDRNVDVVTVASVDLPVSALTQEGILSELQSYSPILENENVKPGLFRIARKSADGEQLVSVDINAIVPQEFRENTKTFSRDNNQESFYDLGKGEVVESGGDGRTVLKDPAQIALAIDDLVAGRPVDVQKIKSGGAGKSPVEDVQFLPKRDNQIDFDLDVERPSTPVKLSKRQRSELNRKELREQFPEAVVPRRATDTVGYDITSSPLYKKFKTDDARANAFADRLVEKFNEHKNEPETLLGLRWYDDFTPLLKARYGDDAPVFAELLAATSPNNTPRVNFQFAEAAYNQWKSGAFDNMIAKFEEGLGKLADGTLQAEYEAAVPAAQRPAKPSDATYMGWWVNSNDLIPRQAPRGAQPGPLFGMHSKAVLKVVTRRWLTENTGLKTNNFVQNLLGLSDEATIDLWAARTMREAGYEGLQDRWRILPENAKPVADADFLFSQRAFRVAAERLGLKPQQLQGALWFIEKKRWADKGWGELDLGDYRTEIERFIESEIPDPVAQQELF